MIFRHDWRPASMSEHLFFDVVYFQIGCLGKQYETNGRQARQRFRRVVERHAGPCWLVREKLEKQFDFLSLD